MPMTSATDGNHIVDVDIEDGMVTVEWDEPCDDHYGWTTRRASFPLKVVTVLMKRQEYLTDKPEDDK